MSIEEKLDALTAAIVNLTAAVQGKAGGQPDDAVKPAVVKTAKPEPTTILLGNGAEVVVPDVATATPARVAAVSAPPAAPAPAPVAEALDYVKDVRPLILRISKEKGRDTAVALLQKFGVAGGPDLKPEQLADFVAAATDALK